jgi:integrase
MAAKTNICKPNDSIQAKFSKSALRNKGAAIRTKVRMNTTWNAVAECAKAQRWGGVEPATLTLKQLKNFVAYRLAQGIGARSIQNEMSHIRRALQGAGRSEFDAKVCPNSELGVPSGTRKGVGKVVNPEVLQVAREKALPDTKVLMDLSRFLGLRELEAVMSANSLKEWERDLAENRPIIVRYGTKGGRIRSVVVAPKNAADALLAVRAGRAILQKQEHLVVSKNLKAALEQHSDRLARLGLKGENSGHSLRRAFAMDQYKHYLADGCSEEIALSRTSNDLGHGDGRGRWVYNNYLRSSFEAETM